MAYPLLNNGSIPQTRSLRHPVDVNYISHDDPAAFAYFQQELSSPLQPPPTTHQHPSIMVPPQSPTLATYYFENGWVNHYYDPKRKYLSSRRMEPPDPKRPHFAQSSNADEWREHLLQYAHTLYSSSPRNPYLLPLLHSLHDAYPSHLPTLLLLACVYYSYQEYALSLRYNHLILKYDPNYVEAMSNIGTTLRSMGKTAEAERWWCQAVKLRPAYWDAVENLVGVLCAKTEGETRYQEALVVCEFVESFFFKQPTSPLKAPPQLPVHQLSRLQNLFYAKGNLRYALGDTIGAQREYEKGLELAFDGIDLVSLCRLICFACYPNHTSTELPLLLLQPDQAVRILQLVFPNANGVLPSLVSLTGPEAMTHIQQTNQTTSVLLLTLAKLYQDLLHTQTHSMTPKPSLAILLPLYYMSLALHASPSTANNLGIILSNIPATITAHAIKMTPQPLTGTMLAMQYYMYGLQLDPRHPHLYTNLGSLLKDMGHLNEAVSMYEKAVEFNPKFDVALANLGNAIKDLGRVQESVQWYRRAVEVNPNFVDAVCGLVNSLNGVCDWRGRGGVKNEASVDAYGQLIPASIDQQQNSGWMGHVVDIVNHQLEEGSLWGAGILNIPYGHPPQQTLGEYLINRWVALSGDSLDDWRARLVHVQTATVKNEGGWLIRMVERIMRRLQHAWYLSSLGQPHRKSLANPEATAAYARPLIPAHLSAPPVPTVLPFHTFTYPLDARQVRLISHRNALRISHTTLTSNWLPAHVYPPPQPPHHKLKIGYISSDFNNHPLSHLMQSVFGMHDRAHYTIYCYATTPSDQSPYRLKIEQESEHFMDVSSWSNQQVVERVVADGIHVLVNLNGYTKGARNEIFAARPCPVQCSFMGFAGTLGGQWCDYIIADPIVCPPEKVSDHVWRHQRGGQLEGGDLPQDLDPEQVSNDFVYTEKFIYMPHSYFVNDHKQGFREPDSLDWTHEEEKRWQMRRELFPQLPDDVIIFANFNQLYKLEPDTFRVWLRILERVPNSILWLLRFPPAGEHHLKRCASAWAGPHVSQRVIFTDVAPKHIHIHRGRVADLFLDTPECNAHTTAADILWSGTPILTYPKYVHKMCSRVGASIAMATGLGDAMVVMTAEAYEQRAVELAQSISYSYHPKPDGSMHRQGHGQLMELRKQLFSTREQSRLFDTARWTRNLERGYAEAWRRWATGEAFKEDRDGCIWVIDPDDHVTS